jgi:type II secretory pathway component GspD/PulD (secretin)
MKCRTTMLLVTITLHLNAAVTPAQTEQSSPTSFAVRSMSADRAANRLRSLLGKDAAVTFDDCSNVVFLRASPEKVELARRFLQRYDNEPSNLTVITYAAKFADVERIAAVLPAITVVAGILEGDEVIEITVESFSNEKTVVITGRQDSMQRAAQISPILDFVFGERKPKCFGRDLESDGE